MGRKKRRRVEEEAAAERLELHGRTVEQALQKVQDELFRCWKRGLTPVLVITGKGVHSHDGVGRLHKAVKELLHAPQASKSLGVRTCKPTSGGGAWLVHLWPPRGKPERDEGEPGHGDDISVR